MKSKAIVSFLTHWTMEDRQSPTEIVLSTPSNIGNFGDVIGEGLVLKTIEFQNACLVICIQIIIKRDNTQ